MVQITFKRRVYRYWDNIIGKYKSVPLLDKKLKIDKVRLVTFHTGYDKFLSTSKRKVLANKRFTDKCYQ